MAQRGMQEWNPKWTRIDVTQENKTKKKLASGMTTSKKKKGKKKKDFTFFVAASWRRNEQGDDLPLHNFEFK